MGQGSRTAGAACLPQEPGRGKNAPLLPKGIIGRFGSPATAVALQADPNGHDFRIVILSGTEVLLRLGPYAEEEVVAEWRTLAAAAGLPLTVRLPNGSVVALGRQVGRLPVGPLWPRSRHKLLTSRRPRFLTRRKTGRVPGRPRIFREAEIVSGRDV